MTFQGTVLPLYIIKLRTPVTQTEAQFKDSVMEFKLSSPLLVLLPKTTTN